MVNESLTTWASLLRCDQLGMTQCWWVLACRKLWRFTAICLFPLHTPCFLVTSHCHYLCVQTRWSLWWWLRDSLQLPSRRLPDWWWRDFLGRSVPCGCVILYSVHLGLCGLWRMLLFQNHNCSGLPREFKSRHSGAARHTRCWWGPSSSKQLSTVCLVCSADTLFHVYLTEKYLHRGKQREWRLSIQCVTPGEGQWPGNIWKPGLPWRWIRWLSSVHCLHRCKWLSVYICSLFV